MGSSLGRNARRTLGATVIAGVGLLAVALPAWAPHVAQMQVTPATAKPGDEVTVFGPRGYGKTNPVEIRWETPDGPVLGSFQPTNEGFAQWGPGTVRIPMDAKPGTHLLVVTQKLLPDETHIRGVPVKTVIQIAAPDGSVPVVGAPVNQTVAPRPADLVESDSPSAGTLFAVGLGAAGVGLFAAGVAAVVASRRREAPRAVAS